MKVSSVLSVVYGERTGDQPRTVFFVFFYVSVQSESLPGTNVAKITRYNLRGLVFIKFFDGQAFSPKDVSQGSGFVSKEIV